ncbi:Hint domain-containing protein [Cochlodiniinecator piscidefendens]|uniref:Hint domain-containing protein n=1 Tax=Cochlodiniinecator piscidefendens TaxID=2715756 RepID=UPI001408C440|nr:Hint domain-containing protein [Cochlodiniinecator piscidefendens]
MSKKDKLRQYISQAEDPSAQTGDTDAMNCHFVRDTTHAVKALQTLAVYKSDSIFVSDGANLGDILGDASELVLDDIYQLRKHASCEHLSISRTTSVGDYEISLSSEVGRPGAPLFLDCAATFMSPDGTTLNTVILVELHADQTIAATYLLPLAPLTVKTDYCLVGVDQDDVHDRFAQLSSVSFTGNTHITMANGEQKPVHELCEGDRVLTRDNGPQKIRWVGQTTLRAHGDLAPVVIEKGTLNNENDLTVSANHRLFIYQRGDALGAGRSEIAVQARNLVNGSTVYRAEGGFVEYFQLLFDAHEIIYAEGIATESMMLDTRTRAAVPKQIGEILSKTKRTRSTTTTWAELDTKILPAANAVDMLRNSSAR